MGQFTLDECGTDLYPDIDLARRASVDIVAAAVAKAIRTRVNSGDLVVINGVVVFAKSQRSIDTCVMDGVYCAENR